MNIAITGGGTGGHLAIANALKEELNRRNIKPIYIGSLNGQDQNWFASDTGFEKTYFLSSHGVVNKKGFKKLSVLGEILRSALTCRDIFKQHNVQALFCVGGYSAAPASLAATALRIPLYIHEQNAITGTLNRLLRPFAKEFFSSYDSKSKVTDYPVRDVFFESRRIRKELKTIIFLGGSQGASFINELCAQSAAELLQRGIRIIHQTGKNEFDKIDAFYKKQGLHVECFAFCAALEQKIQEADFAVSRAGASTLWELSANALPSLFIPYPHAAKNHQYFNAKKLVEQKSAILLTQDTLDTKTFLSIIDSLELEKMSTKLSKSITHNGIKAIADIITKV